MVHFLPNLNTQMILTLPTCAIPITNPSKKPTSNTNVTLLQLCNHLEEAKQVHALMIKTSQISDTYSASRLAEFYAISDHGSLKYAETVVYSMEEPYIFSWNTLIRGNLIKKNTDKTIFFFDQMLRKSIEPDHYTFTLVLKACTQLSEPEVGKQIHSQIMKRGLEHIPFIRNKLIHFYSVFGSIVDARKLFDTSSELDIVTWNSMLEGYAENEDDESLHQIFNAMPSRDVVSWNTMIAYYVRMGDFREALEMFRRMQEEEEQLDRVTLISILAAVAHLGALAQGRWVHACTRKQRIKLDEKLGSALVHMYSKCGCLDGAMEAFNETKRKSVDVWNAMIGGLATNGQSLKAIELFSKMELSNVRPNAITFSCILNACSHGGLVEEGWGYFNRMKIYYGIEPDIAHYGCLVDLLGRAGLFDKAKVIIDSMPIKADAVMWKALLGACRIHGNFEMGEKVGLQLIELDPDDHANYVLLSNVYAMANKWDQVHKLRKTMWERGTRKPPGCSSIELDGIIHEFTVGDITHSRKKEIYEMLDEMGKRLKLAGYVADTKQVLLDINEEVKENSLGHHSEKLAVAFGLINTRAGTTIRINPKPHPLPKCIKANFFLHTLEEILYGGKGIDRPGKRIRLII
ncbi:hypothetical protein F0562_033052 [Nyssa sinensis]|uniref:DYW domain-containing protein n=1 Tax=Nyssa sinensis TaxID=561372 RepID=A0A5J5AUY5_9ASTE|nr:hypothetical protein F0562_033052 [Nyssa sinensis]